LGEAQAKLGSQAGNSAAAACGKAFFEIDAEYQAICDL